MKRSAADLAHGLMCLLVALYGASVVVFMRMDAMPLPAFFLLAAALFALGLLLSKKLGHLGFDLPDEPDRFSMRVFLAAAGFTFAVLMVYLVAYWPGGFSSDNTYQWRQITGDTAFSDWHPALHTIFLWLLTRIANNLAFVVAVQALCYALATGYLTATLHRWRVPRALTVLTALYLGGNPGISNLLIFPWKDCAFAICVLVLSAQLFALHASRGAWLSRKRSVLALGVTLCLCAILRHNGIALVLAVCVWLFVSFPKRFMRLGCAMLAALSLFLFVKGPVYGAFDVEKTQTRIDELIGLPLTVLSHIYVEAPESLDADIVTFLEDVAPREIYAEHHRAGDWNETKWYMGYIYTNRPNSVPEIFSFTLRAMIKEPALGMEALGLLWQMPMWPVSDAYWRIAPHLDPSAGYFGFVQNPNPLLMRILNALCRYTSIPAIAWIAWLPGFWLMAVMVFCVLFARRRPLSALLMPAMLIAYHLATCVMLSSPTDYRFFLSIMMTAPAALIALLARPSDSLSRKETV